MSERSAARGREPPAETDQVSATELYERITAGKPVRILDVRDRDEVDAWRIDGPGITLTQLPASRVLQAAVTDSVADLAAEIGGEGPITVVCAEGEASDYVAGALTEAGFEARNLADGMEGWARVYRATEIATGPTVVQYHRPSSGCLSYLVIDDGESAVVDPLRAFTDRYVADAADYGAEISAVVDTHLHADHVSGLRDLAAAADAPTWLPAESVEFDAETAADGCTIPVGDADLGAVELPGHTSGMTGFAVADVLLTGDSLFLNGVARPDLQVADTGERESLAGELHETLVNRLTDFDDDTFVAPGHASEAAATGGHDLMAPLGNLRDRLAAFALDRSAFVDRVLSDLPPPPANADRIVSINRGVESVDADAAFELELGPNNCAAGTWS